MSFAFNSLQGLIVVEAEVVGPTTSHVVRLALDTGSNGTVVHPDVLTQIAYDLSKLSNPVNATTANGIVKLLRLPIAQISPLGHTAPGLVVAAHRLSSTSIDGLLGLDFLRGQILTIDFQKGEITLTPGGSTP